MAYAGASLPVLLIITVSGTKLSDLVTGQNLAEEIVRAVVGTIGLVAAVPITTGLAVLVADIRRRPAAFDEPDDEDDEYEHDEYEDEEFASLSSGVVARQFGHQAVARDRRVQAP
jgi:hypothetical protein